MPVEQGRGKSGIVGAMSPRSPTMMSPFELKEFQDVTESALAGSKIDKEDEGCVSLTIPLQFLASRVLSYTTCHVRV